MAARSTRSLTENRITHILSVCRDDIPAELPEAGFCHMRIAIEDVDYADLLIHLPSACRFIDSALRSGGNVLVHCGQGLSRSAAVVAAYRKLRCLLWNQYLITYRQLCAPVASVSLRPLKWSEAVCPLYYRSDKLLTKTQRVTRFGSMPVFRSNSFFSNFVGMLLPLLKASMSSGALGWTTAWLQQVFAEIIHFLEPFDLDASVRFILQMDLFMDRCIFPFSSTSVSFRSSHCSTIYS